jgi:hypothetical protein
MSDATDRQEIITSLTSAGKAMGLLAQDETIFRAAVDAFRAADGDSFQRLLTNLKITDCELICLWLRSKEIVLECLQLCGPPREPITVDDIPAFAEIVAKITGDEELVEVLANTVRDRDAQGFANLVKQLGAQRYCHLLCHWALIVRWRLVCDIVCSPRPVPVRELEDELTAAGAAVRGLLQDKAQFATVIKAAAASDCQTLTTILGQKGNCFWICEWLCSWRCILVCLPRCRAFPPSADTSILEMRAFAQAAARLAAKDGAYAGLVDAVLAQDADTFATLVKQLEVGPFCLQLCHWICFSICKRFCVCVCPPAATIPLFTHVGAYKITTHFTPDGTTTAGNLAFTSTIPLIGIMPDGTAPDALEYHFRYEKYPLGGGPTDFTSGMIPASRIGELEYFEWDGLSAWVVGSADYWVNNPGATATILQQFGPPLVVSVNKDVKPGGWIEVPRENSFFIGGIGRFIPDSGILANLDTTKLTDETFDLTLAAPPLPLKAGDSVPSPADRSEVPHFKIYFEARKVLGAVPVGANNLDKIALSNTHFTYIRHLDWAGYTVAPPMGDSIMVLSLDVQELLAGGCSPLSKDVHALFTAYHPYLGSCSVYLEGPGIPPPAAVNPPISADGQAVSPLGGQDFDISKLGPCAYIVWIDATLRLTIGYGAVYGTFRDHIAFCIR